MVYYIDLFLYVELSLLSRNKSRLDMMYDYFNVLLNLVVVLVVFRRRFLHQYPLGILVPSFLLSGLDRKSVV